MLQFLKYVFATLVGLFLFSLIGFLVMIGIFVVSISSSEDSADLNPNSVMKIELTGIMSETADESFYNEFLDSEDPNVGLNRVLKAIALAKTNENIKGIYIEPSLLSAGSASLREIRNALTDFKESGKFVVSYSGAYTQGCYYLSSVADKVYLNPQGSIDLIGGASSSVFYKGLLDKLGVEMQVIKVGTYKSFCEQYTNTKMSDENREQTSALLGSLWKTMLSEIALSRNISEESIRTLVDSFIPFMEQEKVLASGLVDGLLYRDQVIDEMKKLVGVNSNDLLQTITYSDFLGKVENETGLETESSNKVAVMYAVGEIDNGNTDGISSSSIVKKLGKLARDSSVKAVVIRVNSPGGSAYGSEQMWHAVSVLKEKKPVVVSMGDYAASGGYYMSCNASRVLAEPNTITGSIGIFGVVPNVEGLVSKLGITFDEVKTNKYSNFGDISRPLTPEERNIMQGYVDRGYELFIKRCADGRGLSLDSINKIGQGRVWSGADALQKGLVDGLGDLNDAIETAAQLAKLEDYTVSYPKRKKWYDILLDMPSVGMDRVFGKMPFDKETAIIKRVKSIDYIQASLPYETKIK